MKENERENKLPRKIRLPGFIVEQDIGLGDAIKRATTAMGIKPCGGCEARAAVLNSWVVLGNWKG